MGLINIFNNIYEDLFKFFTKNNRLKMMNFQGYSNDKPTSRVLNPPGGRSNNIFGYSEEPKQTNEALKNKTNRNQGSDIFGNGTAQVDNSCNKPVQTALAKNQIISKKIKDVDTTQSPVKHIQANQLSKLKLSSLRKTQNQLLANQMYQNM